jgi:hypothetical protein
MNNHLSSDTNCWTSRNTQFTQTSTRTKMNSVLDGDKRHGADAPISWLYFTGLGYYNRGEQGAT